MPAGKRLEPDQATGREVDLGLVVDDELVAFDGATQIGLPLQPRHDRCRHPWLEERGRTWPDRLRLVEGDIGPAQQIAGPGTAGTEGNADAGVDIGLGRIDGEWRREGGDQALGRRDGIAWLIDPVEQDRELIATEARDGISITQTDRQPAPHRDQQAVAGVVAVAVVDQLKAVEIEKKDGDRLIASPGAGKRLLETIDNERPVRKVGQRIMEGKVGELGFGLLALGDVDRHATDEAVAGGTAERKLQRQPLPPSFVGERDSLLDLERSGIPEHRRIAGSDLVSDPLWQDREVVLADDLLLGGREQSLEGPIDVDKSRLVILDPGGGGVVVHKGREARLTGVGPVIEPGARDRDRDVLAEGSHQPQVGGGEDNIVTLTASGVYGAAISGGTVAVGNGGDAAADASGGVVLLGDVIGGGNVGNVITVGDTIGGDNEGDCGCSEPVDPSVVIDGGSFSATTIVNVSADGGTATATANGGDFNDVTLTATGIYGAAIYGGDVAVGNGGTADAVATGGDVSVGDVFSGDNAGNVITVGDSIGGSGDNGGEVFVGIVGGDVSVDTTINLSANGGTATAEANGGDFNDVTLTAAVTPPILGVYGAAIYDATIAVGNGGDASADASGGSVTIGDIDSSGNSGNDILVGDTIGGDSGSGCDSGCDSGDDGGDASVTVFGGDVVSTTTGTISADGGTATAYADGGDFNTVTLTATGVYGASISGATVAVGEGGDAAADASGGTVLLGDITTGGNAGNVITIGNTCGGGADCSSDEGDDGSCDSGCDDGGDDCGCDTGDTGGDTGGADVGVYGSSAGDDGGDTGGSTGGDGTTDVGVYGSSVGA